jgi:transposase InsO family protein
MKLIQSNIYVEFEELTAVGVSEATLKSGINRACKNWQHCRDPEDARKVLIKYEALSPRYKALYKKTWGDPYKQHRATTVQNVLSTRSEIQDKLTQRIERYYDPQAYSLFLKQMDKDRAIDYTRGAAWLEFLSNAKGKKQLKELGFNTQHELYEATIKQLEHENLKGLNISNVRVLERRIKKYESEGFKSMIQQYALKKGVSSNRATLLKSEAAQEYLMSLYGSPNKPTYEKCVDIFNQYARHTGEWQEITIGTAHNFLKRPENERVWYLARHGEKAWYSRYDTTILRHRTTAPNALWMIDGTPIDLYFKAEKEIWDAKKKVHKTVMTHYNRLYGFFIIDAHSWKIVGYSLSASETALLVADALKEAVRHTGVLPKQLQSDKGSAIMAQAFMVNTLEKIYHTPTRPYSPKGKQIEGVIGHFQSMILRYFPNWAGMNITAKKADSHFNPDYIAAQKAHLPDLSEVKQQIKEAIEEWNSLATKDRKAPNSLYETTESVGTEMDAIGFVELFLTKSKEQYQYQQHGITIQIDNQQYIYEVINKDFYKKHIHDTFEVALDKACLEYIYLYQYGKPVVDADGEPIIATLATKSYEALHDHHEGTRTLLNQKMKLKDEVRNETREEAEKLNRFRQDNKISFRVQGATKTDHNTSENLLKIRAAGITDEEPTADFTARLENRFM